MIGKAIVGFIDILGYKSIVEKYTSQIELIRGLEELIRKITIDLIDGFRAKPFNNQDLESYYQKILDVINVRFISDTVLFTLNLSKIKFSNPNYTQKETISNSIYAYFRFINMFCLYFIPKTGHVLRGGVSIGSHYENDFNRPGNLFIFSEAYINAYNLEREAKTARIIIDDNLLSYLRSIRFDYSNRLFYEDQNGKKCLDFYSFLQKDHNCERVLNDIKLGLTLNIQNNIGNQDVLGKLIYFAKYHNKNVRKMKLNFPKLSIDATKFENEPTKR